jgi:predicted dehydrogenase
VWGHDVLHEGGDDPTLDAFMEFGSGAGFHLHGCRASAFAMSEFDLVGTTGRVQVLDSGHAIATSAVADSPHYSGYRALLPVDGPAGGLDDVLLHAVEDLADAVAESRPPACTAADGIAALEIALAVRESARRGVMIEVGTAQ